MPDVVTENCPVLLVDDDRAMLQSTAQWLSLSGCKVRSFADPVLLLKSIKPGKACVVVSDIRMPGMDGMELLRAVHARDPGTPVILITGHGDIPLAVGAMKAGAFDFFTKPFSPEELLDCVKRAAALAAQERRGVQQVNANKADGEVPAGELEQTGSLPGRVEQYEKAAIMGALLRHDGRIAGVMEELAIPRRTLNEKMRKYGISSRDFRK
ncbi:MAG: response regulator [Nitratireductor sp.]|nr:response regulator [Nitratireductor sp.]